MCPNQACSVGCRHFLNGPPDSYVGAKDLKKGVGQKRGEGSLQSRQREGLEGGNGLQLEWILVEYDVVGGNYNRFIGLFDVVECPRHIRLHNPFIRV